MSQYLSPSHYNDLLNLYDRLDYENAGWVNDPDFRRPAGDFTSYYNGEGLTIYVNDLLKIFYQLDSSD